MCVWGGGVEGEDGWERGAHSGQDFGGWRLALLITLDIAVQRGKVGYTQEVAPLVLQIHSAALRQSMILQAFNFLPAPCAATLLYAVHQCLRLADAPAVVQSVESKIWEVQHVVWSGCGVCFRAFVISVVGEVPSTGWSGYKLQCHDSHTSPCIS